MDITHKYTAVSYLEHFCMITRLPTYCALMLIYYYYNIICTFVTHMEIVIRTLLGPQIIPWGWAYNNNNPETG